MRCLRSGCFVAVALRTLTRYPFVTRRWGVSYALDNCSEWQDVAIEACKVALILVILDLLRITKDRPWFEVRASCWACARRCC